MGQVTVTLNGRTYRLRCGEGEERRLVELATHVSERVEGLAAEFGQVGDDRLLLMAALLIADELWDVRERLWELDAQVEQNHFCKLRLRQHTHWNSRRTRLHCQSQGCGVRQEHIRPGGL